MEGMWKLRKLEMNQFMLLGLILNEIMMGYIKNIIYRKLA